MLSENSKVEVALMQAWSILRKSNLSKYVSNCYQYVKIQVQTFPIYSSYHSFVDVVTYSANQKSVKPSKIAIFQVQMQSKNWCNNQIRSKNIFGHWFFAILSLFWGSFNLGVYDSWQNLSKKQWKNVQPTGGTKAVEGLGKI